MSRKILALFAALALAFAANADAAANDDIDYNRDIRPLLSDNCYQCHGPDDGERSSEMRLDRRNTAVDFLTDSGQAAIKPGDAKASEVFTRITSDDSDVRMPPADSGKQLTSAEVELIRRWIEQGASYREHWAFVGPKKAKPPSVEIKNAPPAQNAIDQFVRAKVAAAKLTPSPAADRRTLIRRVTFDLTGMPPTPAEISAFLKDETPQAYENLVDRLLKSQRFGEHMAHYWLDAARYGDTHGLHLDNERSIWPYRDWVIKAFNQNMPFDQFTIEQLAGDLLPDATVDQRVATGFNRCNVTTSEGGAIRKEFRMRYAVDRVETTATVWLGLTAGCAACHDHKFDPLSQQEFYGLFAYFYSFEEDAMDGNKLLPAPFVSVMDQDRNSKIGDVRKQLDKLQSEIEEQVAAFEYHEPAPTEEVVNNERREYVWIEDDPPEANHQGGWQFVNKGKGPVYSGQKASRRISKGLGQHFFENAKTPLVVGEGDKVFAYVYLDPKNPPREIMLQFNVNGWNHRAIWGENLIEWGESGKPSRKPMGDLPETGKWVRLEFPASEVGLSPGSKIHGWAFTQFDGSVYWDKAGIVTQTPQLGERYDSLDKWVTIQRSAKNASLPTPVAAALKKDEKKTSDAERKTLHDYFVEYVLTDSRDIFDPLHAKQKSLNDRIKAMKKAQPKTLVMGDKPKPLETFVLVRGEYDKEDRDRRVEPNVPAVLHDLPKDAEPNRLGLAKWIVDRNNPLTARVTVNRLWQQLFGVGIVATAEDFGSQGQWPSHPQLLDWLAVEFVDSGWDVKHMIKLMVMSSTYRQSSHVTADRLELDPDNRLLSRGPRFRLDAEMIRDNALACSGLLIEKIGGKGVRPYQPSGLWNAVGYTSSNTANFRRESGENLYRRSLYTFWKRTSPPPVMSIFDAPSREACSVRRTRTNTPQQALLTMNDEQFVEAARSFGQRMILEGGATPMERLTFAFEIATARRPDQGELEVLTTVLAAHHAHYKSHAEEAKQLITTGESKPNDKLDPVELAAYTMAANLILNLDETLTKN